MARLRGEHVEAGWGNQIRSYVLQPYTMVKDLRTGVETSNPTAVLDGDLDAFIEGYLRSRVGTARSDACGASAATASTDPRLVVVRDVRQLAPDQDEEQRGAGEREPERRGDAESLGEDAAERRSRRPGRRTCRRCSRCRPGPGARVGTARWRTVTEVVPHTNACSAEHEEDRHRDRREVVIASPRCVSVSMISPTRMMLPRLTRRVIHPYDRVPRRPPAPRRSRAGRSRSPQPEPLRGVEDEHRPGRAEGDVEDEDRQHQRPHRGVVPHPAKALGDLVADRGHPLRVAPVRRER